MAPGPVTTGASQCCQIPKIQLIFAKLRVFFHLDDREQSRDVLCECILRGTDILIMIIIIIMSLTEAAGQFLGYKMLFLPMICQ